MNKQDYWLFLKHSQSRQHHYNYIRYKATFTTLKSLKIAVR